MTENIIKTVKIKRIITECEGIKTLFFNMKEINLKDYISPKPGQFVMIWVPGVDEVPMSISSVDNEGNWSVTVKDIGECTNAIMNLKVGDVIGVRGPLGNCFYIPTDYSKKIFIIGGGIGTAPLKFLATKLHKNDFNFIVIEGAKIGTELIFIDDFQTLDREYSEVFYCTDDGSYGLEGTTSETFEKIIKDYSKDELSNALAYTCGPEKMMYEIYQISVKHNIEYYASLERIMRCGCGLCGLCALDPLGLLVCKDGPVFSSETLRKIEDFGNLKRDFSGKKIPIE